MKKTVIVGGGPCGMTAALRIKQRYPERDVCIIEKSDQIGKRIKVSGNGRCNFSNANIAPSYYHNGTFIDVILSEFLSVQELFYRNLNLPSYVDGEGRKYPLSNSSKTVWNAFHNALVKAGIRILTSCELTDYERKEKFYLSTSCGKMEADDLILCFGGASYLYSDSSHRVLKDRHGISFRKLQPSLCPLKVKEKIPKNLIGKRARGKITVLIKGEERYGETGEILFKKDGISGIAVFNVSSFLADLEHFEDCVFNIDFIPDVSKETVREQEQKFGRKETIASYVVEELASWIDEKYSDVFEGLSSFVLHYSGFYPLSEAQVTSGGVLLDEMNMSTLSLKKDPHLFIGGELLDVDGRCGGYNIFFAVASGYFIGNHLS